MRIRISPLDKLFSKFIRLRAMQRVHGCERCGTWKEKYTQLQCSHFFGRSMKSLRWDEDNAVGLCFGCHQYFTSHPLEHMKWFAERLKDKFDLLQARTRYTKVDEAAIELYLKAKLKEVKE